MVVEAAQVLPNAVFVGHSTGGMYLLATPEIEQHVIGLALLDTAPDCGWHARYVAMTERDPLPEVAVAMAVYEADRRDENIAAVAVASTPWNFSAAGLALGANCWRGCPTTAPPWIGRTPISITPIARLGSRARSQP